MIVVTDAGPLIYLGAAGHLEVLRLLFARVVVPRGVWDEVVVRGAGMPGADAVRATTWLDVVDALPDPALMVTLDPGEAAAIPLAQRLEATLACDDRAARNEARSRGLKVIGTLAILVVSKRRGHIHAVGPIIAEMERAGMYVAAPLKREVLQAAGEPQP